MISLSAHSINNSVQISKCIYGNLPEHSNYLDKSRRELHCILIFKYLYSHSTSPVLLFEEWKYFPTKFIKIWGLFNNLGKINVRKTYQYFESKKILLKLTSIKSHREKLIQFFIFRNYCSHHFSGTIAMKNYVSGKLHF